MFPVNNYGLSIELKISRVVTGVGGGKLACEYDLHPRIIIFPFGAKKRGLHKDEIWFSGVLIGNNDDGEISIQQRPSLFKSGITMVIGDTIPIIGVDCAGLAVAIDVAVTITFTVVVAVVITNSARITFNFAATIDSHYDIAVTLRLHVMAAVDFVLLRILSSISGTSNGYSVTGLVRVVELDSGVK